MLAVSRVVWCKRIKPTACNNVLPLFPHDCCGFKRKDGLDWSFSGEGIFSLSVIQFELDRDVLQILSF